MINVLDIRVFAELGQKAAVIGEIVGQLGPQHARLVETKREIKKLSQLLRQRLRNTHNTHQTHK